MGQANESRPRQGGNRKADQQARATNPRPVSHNQGQNATSSPTTAQVARAVAALLAVTLADLAEERERTGGDPLPLACLATEAVALADAVRVLTEGRAA